MLSSILLIFNILTIVLANSPELEPFELNDILYGTYSPKTWNGSWISDTTFLYRDSSKNYYQFDVLQERSTLFLNTSLFNEYPGYSVSFSSNLKYALLKYNENYLFRYSRTAQYAVYDIEKKLFYDVNNKKRLQLVTWVSKTDGLAYIYENNIYYLSNIGNINSPRQITFGGVPGVIYNGVPDWVYEEEVIGSGSALWFSPDGTKMAFAHFNDTKVHDFQYVVYGESNNQYPTVVTIKYPKVNTTNPLVAILYIDLRSSTSKLIELNNFTPYLFSEDHIFQFVKWANNSDVVVGILTRVQNEIVIVRCNVETTCNTIYSHHEPNGWIDASAPIFNSDGSKYLMITSEIEGLDSYKHLSLIENNNFDERKRLTFGKRVVLSVLGWNEEQNLVYYVAPVEGIYSQQQVYEVNLVSGIDRCLTCNFNTPEGLCKIATVDFSKGFSYYTRICRGPGPDIVQIYNVESNVYYNWQNNIALRNLLDKKMSAIEKNLQVQLSSGFIANVRLLLPPDFIEEKKYPMIVGVYGGPNSNQISDYYSVDLQHYLVTNRKYIYAFIDGRGCGRNGDNMMFQIYKKLGNIEVADHIEVTKYLQEKYLFVDSSKTGLWGWSYGGFLTLHVLAQDVNNVFKFGLAVAPVTNFNLYDSIYTERYLGLNTEDDNMGGYNRTDLTRMVESFRNKTFYIIHGSADDNVHYQNSMLLCKALEQADILFFQQSYPDENHGLGSVLLHVYHTIDKFFEYSVRNGDKENTWMLK